VPAAQLVHASAVAPLDEYDPALQGPVGALRPRDAQYMPAEHGVHADCPVTFCCVPTGQGRHETETAPPVEYAPAWQGPDTEPSPEVAQYLPGSHRVHMADDAPPDEYVPVWHKPLTAVRPVEEQ
jgi:hypothetical protein